MSSVKSCALPAHAELRRYLDSGVYTDCFYCEIDARFSQAEYVQAFYTSWLFRLERMILKRIFKLPSTDAQARQLALGYDEYFAAWRVEARSQNQLLLTDIHGRTRSWLMTLASASGSQPRTRLFFGSAVTTLRADSKGAAQLLLGLHRLYSRLLLRSAASRLRRGMVGAR